MLRYLSLFLQERHHVLTLMHMFSQMLLLLMHIFSTILFAFEIYGKYMDVIGRELRHITSWTQE